MQNIPSSSRQCLLFDLDGTLVDTADDLCAAMQVLLEQHRKPAVDAELFRNVVSHGSFAMICLAFELQPDDPAVGPLREAFLKIYRQQLSAHSKLFDGCEQVLNYCAENKIPWGIITNKPEHLTLPLLERMRFPSRPSTVVCGDTTNEPKPSSLPMQHALRELGLKAEQCVYFGDADRDIEAAKRVNMPSVAVSWGYIQPDDDIEAWGAESIIHHPTEILDWLVAN